MNIRKRILIPMIALTIICGIAVLVSSILLYDRELNNAMYDKINVAMNLAEYEIQEIKTKVYMAAAGMAKSPDMVEAFINKDHDKLIGTSNELMNLLMVDYCTIIDNEGVVITRTHDPDYHGDSIAHLPHIASALAGRTETHIIQGPTIRLGVSGGTPVYDDHMNIIGMVSLGFRLDTQDISNRLKELTGCEITLFLNDERVSSTATNTDGTFALGTKADESISEMVLAGERYTGIIELFGEDMLGMYAPLHGVNDSVIGMIFTGYYTEEDTNKSLSFIMRGVLITLFVLVICIAFALYISKAIEARLVRANERTMLMLQTSPMGAQIFNKELQVIDCNEAAVRLYGFRDKQAYIADFMKSCHPEFQPDGRLSDEKATEMLRKAFTEGYNVFEWTHQMTNGTPIPSEVTLVRAKYHDDDVVVGYTRDLREYTRMMRELQERETELVRINEAHELQLVMMNAVVSATKIALWDMEVVLGDPVNPDNKFLWSKEFRGLLGYSNDKEFPNMLSSWSDKLHPEDKERAVNAFAAHMLDVTGQTPFDIEYRLLKKNQEYSYYRATGETIRDEEGKALRVAGALMDITETKNLQINLEHERSVLQTIFDSIPDLVFCKDADLNYTRCNKSLLNYFALKEEDLIGKDDVSGLRLPAKIADDFKLLDHAIIAEEKMVTREEHVPAPDGSKRLFETCKVPLMQDGKVTGLMGIARDITERKSMEEAAQSANRSKSVFLANMSHEIRTPMNSIIGFSELAQSDEIPEKTRSYLANIQDSAEWLLKIINDILDISKIESGKIELEQIPFDLPDIFTHCQSAIMPKITEKGIMLYCYAEPSIGKKLLGDPVRLRQIIMNLLSNAVKFTNSGTVKFLASISEANEDNVTVQFEIKDSGIGMTSEQIARIFNPFMQAEDSITRRFGGTGLGLTITKNIIELMGSTLNVESIPGIGSKFSFALTFNLIDKVDITHDQIVLNDFEKPNFSGEVLICEDNSLNQQVICDHLGRVGLKTVVAHDGKEGVDIISQRINNKEKPFDLIFMDIHMPVMDGLDASAKILKMGVQTPIVALTANIMSNDMELYKNSGMHDTVGKPFTTQELWRCLAKYIPVESFTAIDKYRQAAEDSETKKKLKANFVKSNQTTYADFMNSINAGDLKAAHRTMHSLKSNAAQIDAKQLRDAAMTAEATLKEGRLLTREQEKVIKLELEKILTELAPLMPKEESAKKTEITDVERIWEIIEALEPLLKNKSTKCLRHLDEIKLVPGTEDLVNQMEEYNFKLALEALEHLKKEVGISK